jgi:hypothetical protein
MHIFSIILFYALVFCCFPFSIWSQVTYVDIDPDSTISAEAEYFDLDLNEDGYNDFRIVRYGPDNEAIITVEMHRYNSSVSCFTLMSGCYFAYDLDFDDPINDQSPWIHYFYGGILALKGPSYCMHSGFFVGKTDGFIGIRVSKNELVLYGWIRIDVAEDGTWFTLKDYAYSPTAILAGQAVGIDKDILFSQGMLNFSVYPNPATTSVTIEYFLGNKEYVNITILNSRGQIMEILIDEVQEQGSHVLTWDTAELPAGVYLYQIRVGDKNASGKVVLMK